jgi:hypothetical protein
MMIFAPSGPLAEIASPTLMSESFASVCAPAAPLSLDEVPDLGPVEAVFEAGVLELTGEAVLAFEQAASAKVDAPVAPTANTDLRLSVIGSVWSSLVIGRSDHLISSCLTDSHRSQSASSSRSRKSTTTGSAP